MELYAWKIPQPNVDELILQKQPIIPALTSCLHLISQLLVPCASLAFFGGHNFVLRPNRFTACVTYLIVYCFLSGILRTLLDTSRLFHQRFGLFETFLRACSTVVLKKALRRPKFQQKSVLMSNSVRKILKNTLDAEIHHTGTEVFWSWNRIVNQQHLRRLTGTALGS